MARDFRSQAVGCAVPHGISDSHHDCGTVYVGQSADTPAFAVDNLARWCQAELPERYPNATQLFMEANGGGSNTYHERVWKRDLQTKIADAFRLTVTVCHYRTGTSGLNPIEHSLFSEINKTWAGCPSRCFVVLRAYVDGSKTQIGLAARTHLVTQMYETCVEVPDAEMDALAIQAHTLCTQWDYTSSPRSPAQTSQAVQETIHSSTLRPRK